MKKNTFSFLSKFVQEPFFLWSWSIKIFDPLYFFICSNPQPVHSNKFKRVLNFYAIIKDIVFLQWKKNCFLGEKWFLLKKWFWEFLCTNWNSVQCGEVFDFMRRGKEFAQLRNLTWNFTTIHHRIVELSFWWEFSFRHISSCI